MNRFFNLSINGSKRNCFHLKNTVILKDDSIINIIFLFNFETLCRLAYLQLLPLHKFLSRIVAVDHTMRFPQRQHSPSAKMILFLILHYHTYLSSSHSLTDIFLIVLFLSIVSAIASTKSLYFSPLLYSLFLVRTIPLKESTEKKPSAEYHENSSFSRLKDTRLTFLID